MGHGKAGVAGVVAVLGLGIAKGADNCATGARALKGTTQLGDEAASGSRMVWGVEDSARGGARSLDDATPIGTRVGSTASEPGVDLQRSLEAASDVAVEVIDLDLDGDDPPLPTASRCPNLVDVTENDDAWDGLVDEGIGIACAPIVVVGIATPSFTGLRLGPRSMSVERLARECSELGARCLFVGCPEGDAAGCLERTRAALFSTSNPDLLRYEQALVAELLTGRPKLSFVAGLWGRSGPTTLTVARVDASAPR